MKIIKIPLNNYISNIRKDKTIYLGLVSDAKIKGLNEEYLKKEFSWPPLELKEQTHTNILRKSPKFEISIYLGKIIFKEKNIIFKPIDVSENSFEGLKEFYFKDKPDKIINDLGLKQYFLKLYKNNVSLLSSYIDEIKQNQGIKFYYVEDSQYLKENELFAALSEVIQKNDYEIVDFGDDLFYSYLIWSLSDFIIAYDIGLQQDKEKLFFNQAAYKIYGNDSMYKEAGRENGKNYNYLDNLFFQNISPLKYGVGYLQKEEEYYKGDLEYSLGTRLNRIVNVYNKMYFSLEERPFEYVQYFKQNKLTQIL
ncbi:MAG: hypothetical protein Q4A76_05220 [Porphyromonadaceae bacterium]|nr:hypothetical protein [Porphyromonadaceae bacterium]